MREDRESYYFTAVSVTGVTNYGRVWRRGAEKRGREGGRERGVKEKGIEGKKGREGERETDRSTDRQTDREEEGERELELELELENFILQGLQFRFSQKPV